MPLFKKPKFRLLELELDDDDDVFLDALELDEDFNDLELRSSFDLLDLVEKEVENPPLLPLLLLLLGDFRAIAWLLPDGDPNPNLGIAMMDGGYLYHY